MHVLDLDVRAGLYFQVTILDPFWYGDGGCRPYLTTFGGDVQGHAPQGTRENDGHVLEQGSHGVTGHPYLDLDKPTIHQRSIRGTRHIRQRGRHTGCCANLVREYQSFFTSSLSSPRIAFIDSSMETIAAATCSSMRSPYVVEPRGHRYRLVLLSSLDGNYRRSAPTLFPSPTSLRIRDYLDRRH